MSDPKRMAGRWLAAAFVSAVALSGCVTTQSGQPDAPGGAAAALAATKGGEKLDPAYRDLLLSHGGRALETDKLEEAASAYKRILNAEPENGDATLGLAETMLAAGNYPEALGYYRALGGKQAFRARALQGEGIALLALGQSQQSVESLRQAVAADATLWRAWNALGRTLDIQGKHDEAKVAYDRALAIEPGAPAVLNNRGVSAMLAGRYADAERDLRAAMEKDRELDRARSNLRLVLAWQGKYGEALADVSRVDAPVVLNNIGYIAMKRGDLGHAEAYFAQAMQMSPAFYDKADRNLKYLQEMKKLQKLADGKAG